MTVVAVASVVPRRRTEVEGTVVAVGAHRRPWVWFDVELADATGRIFLRFLGHDAVPGVERGRRLRAEGTPGGVRPPFHMLNPRYEFVRGSCPS